MSKKEITWSTPKRVVKALEIIPEEFPKRKKIKKIKHCKKTKKDHKFVEINRTKCILFGSCFIISLKCILCGKKEYKEEQT